MIRLRIESVRLDRARPAPASVYIERGIGLVHVRPYRSRRTYTLRLADVAAMIVHRVVKAEVFEARIAKAKLKKSRK